MAYYYSAVYNPADTFYDVGFAQVHALASFRIKEKESCQVAWQKSVT
jgi:hypothetical protein